MLVSVIIVSYNSSALLVDCVRSVLASTVPVEVVVSDNGSTDGSIEPIIDLASGDRRLRVLENGRNLGFAAANNAALPVTRGEWVLFLNPDCIVAADTLARLLAVLAARPEAGMAGCLIRNPDGSPEPGCHRPLPTPRRLLGKWLGRAPAPVPVSGDGPIEAEAISGAFMLVRRAALARVGSFDDGFFMHWEDVDLCRRFRDAALPILFEPRVEVLHYKGRSSRRRPFRVEWHKHRGLIRYLRKHDFAGWPAPFFAPVAAAIVLRFLVRALRMLAGKAAAQETSAAPGGEAVPDEIWVFGATSVVGRHLLPRLIAAGQRVRAFSSDPEAGTGAESPHLRWQTHDIRVPAGLAEMGRPRALIHLAPLHTLPPWLPPLAERGLAAVIAFGTTSIFTKADSPSGAERSLVEGLRAAEAAVARTCAEAGLRWAIFRPTMIYSLGHDRNVTRLARFIERFGFLPLPGSGRGLRQPVHADDLAKACLALLERDDGWNRAYNLSGGEALSYRALVEALFRRLGRRARIVELPDWLWRFGIAAVRLLPAYRDLRMSMVERADLDMCFSHDEARQAFGYTPRPFSP